MLAKAKTANGKNIAFGISWAYITVGLDGSEKKTRYINRNE